MRAFISAAMMMVLLVVLFGCSDTAKLPSEDTSNLNTVVDLNKYYEPTDCNTSQCIQDFLDDLPCPGTVAAELNVFYSGSPYNLSSHHIVDGCSIGGVENNWWSIIGEPIPNRPLISVPGSPLYELGYHAGLHIVENDPAKINLIKDVILDISSHMGNSDVPGIQFEANSLKIWNSEFRGGGTTHFLAAHDLDFSGLTITSNHEFVIGREFWCGVNPPEVCDGPPPSLPSDGSTIKNSTLYGDFIIDCIYNSVDDHTITFQDNPLITGLDLDVELQSTTTRPVVELIDNVFANSTGAKVIIKGDYEVVATGNETFQGPCPSDALADFDISSVNAGNTNPLTLNSYVYNGESYCPDEEQILSKEVFTLGGDCNTVYVRFEVKGPHTEGQVHWGPTGCTNTVNTTVIGNMHYASFDVTGLRSFYWQVESTFCNNIDTSSCIREVRPKYGVYGCPPPPWWPF